MLEQVRVSLGHGQPYPVRQLEAGLLAHRIHGVDQVVDPPAAHEVFVEVEVERDRDTVGRRHGPAVLAIALDEHFVARELVTRNANAPARELVEPPRFERRPNSTELPPELRAEYGEVRLDAELARLDLREQDLPDAKLV